MNFFNSVYCSSVSYYKLCITVFRDGSGCLSYTLQKNPTTGGVEKNWILHDAMPFQKNELPQRLEQLKCRIRECRSALDLLIKINNGEAIEHLLIATVNLNHFRVCLLIPAIPVYTYIK